MVVTSGETRNYHSSLNSNQNLILKS